MPMDDTAVTLDVSILGREYRVSCKESERTELLQAVQFLDRRMREIRDSGKVAGTERIAVMAALNIAHELLRAKGSGTATGSVPATSGFDSTAVQRRISSMQAAIDRAMAEQDKLF
jgi:cell division protein ZapA